ncbi:MAG: hypothetical protein NTV69_09490 [Caldilinea sp.]|jgi:hypothetical protein|nr:hypothetical protein [Caldilinea sp.]
MFKQFMTRLRGYAKQFPDVRKGGNHQLYTVSDAYLSAFGIFFTQSPSFLAYQREMRVKLNLIREIVATHWNGRHRERWTYRFVNDVLLRDSADALSANWCEIIIVREDTQAQVYHNTFITDHRLTDQSVAPIVASGQLEDRKREPQHPQESWVSSRTQFRPWPTALSCPAAQPQPPGVSLAHCADPD